MRFEIRQGRHKEDVSSENSFVVFGRDPSCDVVVKSPRCSRRHASIRIVPEGFHLLDMGSSNGVYVRDQKVDDAILQEGDTFAIGDAFIRILDDEIPPTLSMAVSEAAAFDRGPSGPALRAVPPLPPPPPPAPSARVFSPVSTAPDPAFAARNSSSVRPPRTLHASTVLGVASVAVGMGLLVGTLIVSDALGLAGLFLGLAGFASVVSGLARFTRVRWTRKVSYAVFALWALTCVLAPFGAIGLAYQLRGEDRPETDSFFSVVLALTALIGLAGIVAATLLARLYVPGPVPS